MDGVTTTAQTPAGESTLNSSEPETLRHRNVTDPPRLRRPGRREAVATRQADAIELRKRGASYRVIGKRLGISQTQAMRDCRRALAQIVVQRTETAQEMVTLELEKLDELELRSWIKLERGDMQAGSLILRICESRRRLLGLDAPSKTHAEVSTPSGPTNGAGGVKVGSR